MKAIHLSRSFLWMTGLATVLVGVSTARADLPSEHGDMPRSSVAPADHRTVQYLHSLSDLAVSAGEIAQKNGSTQAVRDFGATIVSDHTAGDQELLSYAKKAGIPPERMKSEPAPPEMTRYLQRLDRLRTLTGQQFDQEFAATMRDGYAQTIALVHSTQPHLADRDFSSWLNKRMPVLEKNYQTAARLAASPQQPPSPSQGQPQPNSTGSGQTQHKAPGTTQ